MQTPSRRTVLAPFAGERATHSGAAATFSSSDGRFVVRTEGPDGKPADFPVRYTFGVYPLQQYLLDLPGGRLQALGFAWDTREGPGRGQMWRHLYEGERIRPGDPLHWTGIHQNWNFMCADCHSTNVRKNYDAASKTFATTYSEISVGCEACHGPASRHVELASRQAVRAGMTGLAPALDERRGVSWGRDPSTGRPVRSTPRTADREIEVCARCHSRRTQLIDTVSAADSLHEGFRVSLLEPGLFHPDGQMREEVYNYASFLQSRMYASGVTCSDCHDPHTEAPRLPGDALCLTCHDGPTYDGPQHHLHPKASGAPGCVSCHMPAATYMLVDTRHDHSFRVPRPDRTSALGTPNACASCHADRDPAWAAEAIRKHRPSGSPGAQTFAEAFAAFDRGAPAGTQGVLDVAADSRQPAIVRASALWRLQHAGANVPSDLLERAARDESPLVRRVAAGFPFASTLGVLLGDRTLSVRLEAAGVLAQIPPADLPAALAGVRPRALEEYVAVQRFNADRPDGQLNIATGLTALGRSGEALAAMREAIRPIRRSCRRTSTSPTCTACRATRPPPSASCAQRCPTPARPAPCTMRSASPSSGSSGWRTPCPSSPKPPAASPTTPASSSSMPSRCTTPAGAPRHCVC
jgi:hypothetical protein